MADSPAVPPDGLAEPGEALAELGAARDDLRVVDLGPPGSPFTAGFARRYPGRYVGSAEEPAAGADRALAWASDGSVTVLCGPAARVVLHAFGPLRGLLARARAPILCVATDGGWTGSDPAMLEDLPLLRGLPGISVVVPADRATARTAVGLLVATGGPGYLRLSPELNPRLGPGSFAIGRARELRAGGDLAILAVGPPVALALAAADSLAEVGLAARVLDLASLAPGDAKAVLRAARDTGALLTLEEHQAATGVGPWVAALTAENAPVPVRRLGVPDLWGPRGAPERGRAEVGLTLEAVRDEAWELLRMKGKVQ